MKKIILLIILLAPAIIAFASPVSIAVVNFDSGTFCTVQEAAVMTDAFRNEMVRSGKANIVDRIHTEALKTEMIFQMSDWVDPAKIKTAGHLLGVDCFIFGNFGIMGETGYLQVQMTEVETGRILHSARMSLRTWREFDQKVRAFANEFTGKIPMSDIFSGSWSTAVERNAAYDLYTITFLTKSSCEVKISGMNGDNEVSQEANGTYSYSDGIFKLTVNFRNPIIPELRFLQWTSALSFNESRTAFNILVKTTGSNQVRATFMKE